jgi:hypothetical protein
MSFPVLVFQLSFDEFDIHTELRLSVSGRGALIIHSFHAIPTAPLPCALPGVSIQSEQLPAQPGRTYPKYDKVD